MCFKRSLRLLCGECVIRNKSQSQAPHGLSGGRWWGCGPGGSNADREKDTSQIFLEEQRAGETSVIDAAMEPTYPDGLGNTLHDLPAEEARVSLALLLPPEDHVPPIGLLVGAGAQEPLEVQAMVLPKVHHVYATSLSTLLVLLKQEGPSLPLPALPEGQGKG